MQTSAPPPEQLRPAPRPSTLRVPEGHDLVPELPRRLDRWWIPWPSRRRFRGPVAWLLSRGLLVRLEDVLVSHLLGDKLDHKDWMRPRLHRLRSRAAPAPSAYAEAGSHTPEAEAPGRSAQVGPEVESLEIEADNDEIWFDYIADTGDDALTMYNIARLCLSDLDRTDGDRIELAGETPRPGAERLPRGAFLVVGGDTAYHVADLPTLQRSFWLPFQWAHRQVRPHGPPRPIFAIPGNHDYYDALHGFNRQFRVPSGGHDGPDAPLHLPGFRRVQDASYFAAELPNGWSVWGLDTQHGQMDRRQRDFFRGLSPRDRDKLVLLTPEPPLVYGRGAPPDAAISETLAALGLPRLHLPEPAPEADAAPADPSIGPEQLRLDLSGDIHHYARYQTRSNAASVVAGLGGAFLHPTHPRHGPHQPVAQLPAAEDSRARFARRLLNPWWVLRGGLVWLLGALVAAVVTVGPTATTSTDEAATTLLDALCIPMIRAGWSVGLAPLLLVILAGLLATLDPAPPRPAPSSSGSSRRPAHASAYMRRIAWQVGLWVGLGVGAAAAMLGGRASTWPPLVQSAVLSLCVACALASFAWSLRHRRTLTDQAKRDLLGPWRVVPPWVTSLVGITLAVIAHVQCADRSVGGALWDTLFLAIVALLLLGLPIFAWRDSTGLPVRKRLVVLGLGVIHGTLQLVLPPMLAFTEPSVVLGTLALMLAAHGLACVLVRWNQSALAIATWVVAGGSSALWAATQVTAMVPSVGATVAGAAYGAVWACLLLSGYLAVTSLLGAHVTMVGATARLLEHRGLLRFRLTRDSLTGYVLCLDPRGPRERPARLVERFTLKRPQNPDRTLDEDPHSTGGHVALAE